MTTPIAKTAMLIRRPAADVFAAFVDPAVTTKFWFTHGSGRLREGATVRWDWEMYGVSAAVKVIAFEENRRLVIAWGADDEPPTIAEWKFTARGTLETFVEILESNFSGEDEEVTSKAIESAQGFALVLAGAKAFLEHDLQLQLVRDRFPDGWKDRNAT